MLDEQLVEAVMDAFGIEKDEVTPQLSRDSLAEWDSVGHLKLVLSVEEAFGLRFAAAEIPSLTSVAAIQDAVNRLRAAN